MYGNLYWTVCRALYPPPTLTDAQRLTDLLYPFPGQSKSEAYQNLCDYLDGSCEWKPSSKFIASHFSEILPALLKLSHSYKEVLDTLCALSAVKGLEKIAKKAIETVKTCEAFEQKPALKPALSLLEQHLPLSQRALQFLFKSLNYAGRKKLYLATGRNLKVTSHFQFRLALEEGQYDWALAIADSSHQNLFHRHLQQGVCPRFSEFFSIFSDLQTYKIAKKKGLIDHPLSLLMPIILDAFDRNDQEKLKVWVPQIGMEDLTSYDQQLIATGLKRKGGYQTLMRIYSKPQRTRLTTRLQSDLTDPPWSWNEWDQFLKALEPSERGYDLAMQHRSTQALHIAIALADVGKVKRALLIADAPGIEKGLRFLWQQREPFVFQNKTLEGSAALYRVALLALKPLKKTLLPAVNNLPRMKYEDVDAVRFICQTCDLQQWAKKAVHQLERLHEIDDPLAKFQSYLEADKHEQAFQKLAHLNGQLPQAFEYFSKRVKEKQIPLKLVKNFAKFNELANAYIDLVTLVHGEERIELLMPRFVHCLKIGDQQGCEALFELLQGNDPLRTYETQLINAAHKSKESFPFLLHLYSTYQEKIRARFFSRIAHSLTESTPYLRTLLAALFRKGTKKQCVRTMRDLKPEILSQEEVLYWAGIVIKWGDPDACNSLGGLPNFNKNFKSNEASKIIMTAVTKEHNWAIFQVVRTLSCHVPKDSECFAKVAKFITPRGGTRDQLTSHRYWIESLLKRMEGRPSKAREAILDGYLSSLFDHYHNEIVFILETVRVFCRDKQRRQEYLLTYCRIYFERLKIPKGDVDLTSQFFESQYPPPSPEDRADISLAILNVFQQKKFDTDHLDKELVRLLFLSISDDLKIEDRLKGAEKRIFIKVKKDFTDLRSGKSIDKKYVDDREIEIFHNLWARDLSEYQQPGMKTNAEIASKLLAMWTSMVDIPFKPTSMRAINTRRVTMHEATICLATLFCDLNITKFQDCAFKLCEQFSDKNLYCGPLSLWRGVQGKLFAIYGGTDQDRTIRLLDRCCMPITKPDETLVPPFEKDEHALISMISDLLQRWHTKGAVTKQNILLQALGQSKKFKPSIRNRILRAYWGLLANSSDEGDHKRVEAFLKTDQLSVEDRKIIREKLDASVRQIQHRKRGIL